MADAEDLGGFGGQLLSAGAEPRFVERPRPRSRSGAGSMYELLDSERRAIIDYALKHPEVRHRELAWRMLDEGRLRRFFVERLSRVAGGQPGLPLEAQGQGQGQRSGCQAQSARREVADRHQVRA